MKIGSGGVVLLHTINKVTADRQMTFQLVDHKDRPLMFMDMSKGESKQLILNMVEAYKAIWPNEVFHVDI